VESGGKGDFYFNYAHNCNVGIKKAMEYNPKWVVVSNDDMVKMDDVKVMKMEIDRIERSELNQVQVIFAKKGIYHSRYIKLGKQNFLYGIFNSLFKGREGREILRLEKRFKVEIMPAVSGTAYAMFFNNHLKVKEVGDFIIINKNLAEHVDGFLYDETYINDTEDVDLSIRINYKYNYKLINYNISEKVSGTFGTSKQRAMRGLTGVCYLNSKIDLGIYQILVK
jgi:GT2 family glycosyltransferase